MKDNENKRAGILISDASNTAKERAPLEGGKSKVEKLKKPVIFLLMAVVFAGCMYLIFKPADKGTLIDVGLNGMVPQATDAGMPADKQKAYELASLEKNELEKRDALMSLSDYWNNDRPQEEEDNTADDEYNEEPVKEDARSSSLSLNSYRNAQNTLGSFYRNDNSQADELRRQVEELKQQLVERQDEPDPMAQQLALMEKSFQMATRYLPTANTNAAPPSQPITDSNKQTASNKESFMATAPVNINVVSALYREPSDSAFAEIIAGQRNRSFYTVGADIQATQPKNSIRGCIQKTKTITGEGSASIRLLQAAHIQGIVVPIGSVLTAGAKFANGRLQLKISAIEVDGNIIPVEISAYDLDGQMGLNVPNAPELNALADVAANMSQSTGTSIMMNQNAGQQVVGELSRGVVQGITGYLSKKMRTPKATVKAGYQLFLVSKK